MNRIDLLLALILADTGVAKEQVITVDGNFRFYNAPVVQDGADEDGYVAYISRGGRCVVNGKGRACSVAGA